MLNGRKEEDDPLELALDRLESGMLMISALRHESGCQERLACRIGDLAKERFADDSDSILDAVNMILPEKYQSFSQSVKKMMRADKAGEEGEDYRNSCQAECRRCIAL